METQFEIGDIVTGKIPMQDGGRVTAIYAGPPEAEDEGRWFADLHYAMVQGVYLCKPVAYTSYEKAQNRLVNKKAHKVKLAYMELATEEEAEAYRAKFQAQINNIVAASGLPAESPV